MNLITLRLYEIAGTFLFILSGWTLYHLKMYTELSFIEMTLAIIVPNSFISMTIVEQRLKYTKLKLYIELCNIRVQFPFRPLRPPPPPPPPKI